LRSLNWLSVADASGKPIGPNFKRQEIQEEAEEGVFFFDMTHLQCRRHM
jgi:hypothetical protein